MARHDQERTGQAVGVSDITDPVPYWRHFLGGALGEGGLVAADLEGNGLNDLAYVAGGRAFVRRVDGSELWRSPLLGLTRVVGTFDMNGNGQQELIAAARNRVFVFAGATGEILWAQPDGDMGTVQTIRVADLTGDGANDLLVVECGCCTPRFGKTGSVYSFGAGFEAARKVWDLPSNDCGTGPLIAAFDAGAEGRTTVLHAVSGSLFVLDGATGETLATLSGLYPWVQLARCLAMDVDAEPGEELVCVINSHVAAPDGHKIFVVKYEAPNLELLWSADVGERDGEVVVPPNFVSDLEGDGRVEVLIGGREEDGEFFTDIYDAVTGERLGRLRDEIPAGSMEVGSEGSRLVLTTMDDVLTAWTFDRRSTERFGYRWGLVDRSPVEWTDWADRARFGLGTRLAQLDVDGDGVADFIGSRKYGGAELVAHRVTSRHPTELGRYVFPDDLRPVLAMPVRHLIAGGGEHMVVLRSDSRVLALAERLAESDELGRQSQGFFVGGYYASSGWRRIGHGPVTSRLEASATADAVLVADGAQSLLRLDASDASLAGGARVVWRQPQAWAPIVVAGSGSSERMIGCLGIRQPRTDPPTYEVRLLWSNGSRRWHSPVPGTPFNDILFGRGAQGQPFQLFVQWGFDSDNAIWTTALDLADGSARWDNEWTSTHPNRGPSGFAVHDWNGDRVEDIIHNYGQPLIVSGQTGDLEASGRTTGAYFMPTIRSRNDGAREMILHASAWGVRALEEDLHTPIWRDADADRPLLYGAMAECEGRGYWLQTGLEEPARLKITSLDGEAVGAGLSRYLASGMIFPSRAAAESVGATLGQLTSVVVHSNLTGRGRPSSLVGSTDGWLYALNPCDGTLDFAYELGSPVGEMAFGDTDGDGRDEILVSAADGYLYGLRQRGLPAPEWVWDIDPSRGIRDEDVDSIAPDVPLAARWASVQGAGSYEVAVLGPEGPVTEAFWQDVGRVTEVMLESVKTKVGATYRIAVRARANGVRSPDTASDGVTVVLADTPIEKPDAGSEDGGLSAQPDAGEPDGGVVFGVDGAADGPVDAAAWDERGVNVLLSGRACTCRLGVRDGSTPADLGSILVGLLAFAGFRTRRHRRRPPEREVRECV